MLLWTTAKPAYTYVHSLRCPAFSCHCSYAVLPFCTSSCLLLPNHRISFAKYHFWISHLWRSNSSALASVISSQMGPVRTLTSCLKELGHLITHPTYCFMAVGVLPTCEREPRLDRQTDVGLIFGSASHKLSEFKTVLNCSKPVSSFWKLRMIIITYLTSLLGRLEWHRGCKKFSTVFST